MKVNFDIKTIFLMLILLSSMARAEPIIMSFWSDKPAHADHYPMPGALLVDQAIATNQDFLDKIAHINILAYGQLPVDAKGFIHVRDAEIDLGKEDEAYCGSHPEFCRDEKNTLPQMGSLRAFANLPIKNTLHKTIAIGGDHSESTMLNIFAHPENFSQSLQDLLKEYRLAGVDIDFELDRLFKPEEGKQYAAFIQNLRKRLGNQAIITMDVDADIPTMLSIGSKNWKSIGQNISYIDVMCYGLHSPPYANTTGFDSNLFADPNAPFTGDFIPGNCDLSIKTLAGLGVPMNKILLGIPMYGQQYDQVPHAQHGLYQTYLKKKSNDYLVPGPMYRDIVKNIQEQNFSIYHVKANQYTIGTYAYQPKLKIWYSYESPETIRSKAQYIQVQGLAGAEFWILDQDLPFQHPQSLLKTLVKNLD